MPASSSFQNCAPPSAAAEGVFAVARKFDDGVAQDVQEIAGGVVDAVVAAEIAGVVEGDGGWAGCGAEPAFIDERFQVFGVVQDFEVAADLLVFVADRVHAVGAGGDDELGFYAVEGCDVVVRKLAVEVLVAGAAGAVSGAAFLFSEDREVDFGVVEQLDEGAGRFLRLRIVAGARSLPSRGHRAPGFRRWF